mmetsp:Transcript_28311/g.48084  ORF Transcript_28311/g.48084 Transcript_28311/m.48084 type:complete len:222 (+) Transcript_28311:893-1558(+)
MRPRLQPVPIPELPVVPERGPGRAPLLARVLPGPVELCGHLQPGVLHRDLLLSTERADHSGEPRLQHRGRVPQLQRHRLHLLPGLLAVLRQLPALLHQAVQVPGQGEGPQCVGADVLAGQGRDPVLLDHLRRGVHRVRDGVPSGLRDRGVAVQGLHQLADHPLPDDDGGFRLPGAAPSQPIPGADLLHHVSTADHVDLDEHVHCHHQWGLRGVQRGGRQRP